jgi:hypothetical protein
MGGGGVPKNTTTTTETKLPDWLVNNYQSFIRQTNDVNNKPYQSYGGQLNAGPSQGQQLAGALAQQGATYGLPGQASQVNGLTGLMSGDFNTTTKANPYGGKTTHIGINPYAGQNTYLDKMVANSNQNITDAYNQNAVPALAAQFASGGAFGGSAMQQAGQQSQDTLAKNLAQSTDNLRFQDYTAQQGLAENAINRSVAAQQTDLARNSALAQQDWQNLLSANQQNAANVVNGSQGLNAVNQLQQGYLGALGGYGQIQQDFAQGNIDQAYNDWYQKNYGYDQQKLNNYGNALNSISGNFQGSSATGANPAYKPRTAGGALAAGASGALAGSSFGPWGALIGGVVGAGAYYL